VHARRRQWQRSRVGDDSAHFRGCDLQHAKRAIEAKKKCRWESRSQIGPERADAGADVNHLADTPSSQLPEKMDRREAECWRPELLIGGRMCVVSLHELLVALIRRGHQSNSLR